MNYTTDKKIAEEKGFKPFSVRIYEENSYVKTYYAKDEKTLKESLLDNIHDEFDSKIGGWSWKNGGIDLEVISK